MSCTRNIDVRKEVVPQIPPGEQARIDAGFAGAEGLRRLAGMLNCQPSYIRRCERLGGAPYIFVERAAYHLGCAPDVYDIRVRTRTARTTEIQNDGTGSADTRPLQKRQERRQKKAGDRANGAPAI